MSAPRPDAERAEMTERLKALLFFFETKQSTNRTALARKLGKEKSAISNAIRRGSVSAELREDFARIGVDQRYWRSPTRLDPADCYRTGPRRSEEEVAVALAKDKTAEIARRLNAPHIVHMAIMTLRPPQGQEGDAWWWMDQLLNLIEEHTPAATSRKPKRAASA